jgi:L-ascorbate metabolism protein UlaG (beta-lactamase superfamily)
MSQCLSLATTEAAPDFEHVSVLFAGAATVVLQYGGFMVVVDPAFLHHGDHVHLGYDLTAPGAASAVGQLPPADFVLLSRLDDGHAGRAVDVELDRRLPVLTTTSAASVLRRKGFAGARGLAGWETIRVERAQAAVHVTSVPTHPPTFESFLPDAMGSILEFAGPEEAAPLRAFVSGDSAVRGDLREIPRRHPGVDLALLPVAGTRVLGVLSAGEEGGATVRLVAPRAVANVCGDDEAVDSTLEDFAAAAGRAGLEARVERVEPGGRYVFRPRASRGAPPESPAAAGSRDPAGVAAA